MIGDATYPAIRSRHGVLRDFVPIYSLYQLTINLIVLGAFWWLFGADGHIATTAIFWLMLGWVYQYARRPSVMMVTVAQAEWLEAILHQQQYYDLDADGRWRTTAKNWYQRWPHQFIEFAPTSNGVTLIAPRDVMDAMRQGLELREEHGEVFFADDDRPFAFQPPEQPAIGWSMHAPGALIGVLCVIAWVWHMPTGGMTDWGVSGAALAQGRYETILLHMFAHGGLWHIVMNMSVLAAIGGPLVARFGPMPLSWLRFLTLFVLSGLSGAALYLLFHPSGTVPMLGASGALYGLIALFIRMPANGGALVPIRSAKIGRIGWDLVKQNVFLFVLLAVMSWSHAGNGGLAWEAHLGGFLFGLLAGPLLLPKSEEAASETLVRVG